MLKVTIVDNKITNLMDEEGDLKYEILVELKNFMNTNGFYRINLDVNKLKSYFIYSLEQMKSSYPSKADLINQKINSLPSDDETLPIKNIMDQVLFASSLSGFFMIHLKNEDETPPEYEIVLSKAYFMKEKSYQLIQLIKKLNLSRFPTLTTTPVVEEKFTNVVNDNTFAPAPTIPPDELEEKENIVQLWSDKIARRVGSFFQNISSTKEDFTDTINSQNEIHIHEQSKQSIRFLKIFNESENPEILFSNILGAITHMAVNGYILSEIFPTNDEGNQNEKIIVRYMLSYLSKIMESKCEETKIKDLFQLGINLSNVDSRQEKLNNGEAAFNYFLEVMKFIFNSISSKHCVLKTSKMDFITFNPSLCVNSVEKNCSVEKSESPKCEEVAKCESGGDLIFKIGTGLAVVLFIIVIMLLMLKTTKKKSSSPF